MAPPACPDDGAEAPKWGKDDQKLRDQQLNFYKGDVERLNAVLRSFLKTSGAKCVILVTKGGHPVTKEGNTDAIDTDTVAALVSGAFAATKKLFEVFKEQDFTLTVQKGKHESVYIGLVGGRSLMTVLFDEATNQGKIQLYATECTKKLEQIYKDIDEGRGAKPEADEKISDNFGSAAGGALDKMFG
jgi:predicted regulator of Ras-like GTPase activity (Roadblock/LC7/MglB family)